MNLRNIFIFVLFIISSCARGDSFIESADKGNINFVNQYINNGNDVNVKTDQDYTALMASSRSGNIEIVKLLVSKGANVNAETKSGWTSLMHASYNGNFEISKLLISKGANVNAKNKSGWTPLMYASSRAKLETVKVLISNGAEVNSKNNDGDTAFSLSIDAHDLNIPFDLKKMRSSRSQGMMISGNVNGNNLEKELEKYEPIRIEIQNELIKAGAKK
ncbi:MAG: ankyrin repeat domain-containing protein [Pseudomonadota bacterium]